MKQRIRVEIAPDGKIHVETLGIKGKDCLKYVEVMERLLDAEAIDSSFTEEYYEMSEVIKVKNKQVTRIKGE